MARSRSSGLGPEQAELLRRFENHLAGLQPSEPSPRRDRRPDVVTYRVRVDLGGTKPPLWRRLELASDMFLDELHPVLQAAFGWTDSHLHRFSSGPDAFSPGTEHYLMPFEVEEGDEGVPEQEVRLDELLTDAGDRLFYVYDYGDGWEHTVRLEAVLPRAADAPRATCTAGRRPGPPEDCGGVHGYELFCAATEPGHPRHAEARAEVARMYGFETVPEDLLPLPFLAGEVNEHLAGIAATTRLPAPLAELVHAVGDPREQDRLRDLVTIALDGPADVDPDTAARMVRPYAWLLDRVGEDGIRLTGAGYLPPAHVEAAVAELGMADEWVGKNNREDHTRPVLHLRETAQKMGLLRKHRGSLRFTARGRRLRTDPAALWGHIAEQMPVRSREEVETHAGLVLLVAVAAGMPDDATLVRTLHALGWRNADGSPISEIAAGQITRDTRTVLQRLGALAPYGGDGHPTPEGIAFARTALRTWP
ncbi:plasmid pRiA4b ORF-3 family protein [Pseudonocardia sichuanensis]